jgi:tRNA 2-selenouridine synthase
MLEGGYKAYRQHCRAAFEKTYPFIVLGGKTGSAKTETLLEMKRLGEQVIDLEGLAQHQGSSFGSMNRMTQPSQEHFENLLANELLALDATKRVWIEDESLMIGLRCIPEPVFKRMKNSNVVNMIVPIEERITFLESVYGVLDKDFLIASVLKIAKRLGPVETQKTIQAIKESCMADFIRQVLYYYDKTYQHGQNNRDASTIHDIGRETTDPVENAKAIVSFSDAVIGAQFIQP